MSLLYFDQIVTLNVTSVLEGHNRNIIRISSITCGKAHYQMATSISRSIVSGTCIHLINGDRTFIHVLSIKLVVIHLNTFQNETLVIYG
jgi:hypothetical protein